jgi:GrpB-like predicted nucleotidyltransferase (UPF0157 family)
MLSRADDAENREARALVIVRAPNRPPAQPTVTPGKVISYDGNVVSPCLHAPALAEGTRMERYGGGSIVVADYDRAWPAMFAEERANLRTLLGPLVLTIEHMGSTAVPGLAAKPIIDLLVGVRSLADARSPCIERLGASGYTYLPEYDSWLPGELFFRKGAPGPWTHHAHVMEPSHPRWERFLLFRDYLRAHPDAAFAYANLKRRLADAHGEDIAGYRSAKHDFVEAAITKARAAE